MLLSSGFTIAYKETDIVKFNVDKWNNFIFLKSIANSFSKILKHQRLRIKRMEWNLHKLLQNQKTVSKHKKN